MLLKKMMSRYSSAFFNQNQAEARGQVNTYISTYKRWVFLYVLLCCVFPIFLNNYISKYVTKNLYWWAHAVLKWELW
jgi:hypothetical protein